MGFLNGGGMDRRFFHRLGASRLDRTICSAAGGAGLMQTLGFRYGTEPEQFRHSKLIIAWGANVLATNVHLWPFIVEARRNGARFYTIDPVRNRTGKLADKHFAIYPGSDLALALGLMHVIIGEKLHDADYVANYTNGFEALAQLAARVSAGARGTTHRDSARRRGFARARVRHHAAGGHPAELWNPAQRTRRSGHAGHRGSACPDWIVARSGRRTAALHQPGVSGESAPDWKCRSCSSDRRSGARRASST